MTEIDEVLSYMTKHDCRPNELTYKIVVDGYCKAKKFKEAMDFVSTITDIDDSFDYQSMRRLSSRVRENMQS
jgi:pentatricopeptide repeat domain-containing protein 1